MINNLLLTEEAVQHLIWNMLNLFHIRLRKAQIQWLGVCANKIGKILWSRAWMAKDITILIFHMDPQLFLSMETITNNTIDGNTSMMKMTSASTGEELKTTTETKAWNPSYSMVLTPQILFKENWQIAISWLRLLVLLKMNQVRNKWCNLEKEWETISWSRNIMNMEFIAWNFMLMESQLRSLLMTGSLSMLISKVLSNSALPRQKFKRTKMAE